MKESESTELSARILSKAEEYLYLIAGFILVFAAVGLLISAVYEMILRIMEVSYLSALVHLLDRVLLVLMLAEIIYTIQRIARTRHLEATPFLIVGIIAAVRRILIITAESVEEVNLADPVFQGALAELGLLSVMVLLLAISLVLLNKHDQADKTRK